MTEGRYTLGLSVRGRWIFACRARRTAAMLRLPAHPETWPEDWTDDRRAAMAVMLEEAARLVEPATQGQR